MLHVFLVFLRLGCISFGGPVAHLGYFQDEFVRRRQWLSANEYAELVALCQFIPGPASSQVGAAIGFKRCGYVGALAAWLGFTLPSALILGLAGAALFNLQDALLFALIDGLKLVAIAIVAQAVWTMQKSLCTGFKSRLIALLSVLILLLLPATYIQLLVIVAAGFIGFLLTVQGPDTPTRCKGYIATPSILLLSLFTLLLLFPLVLVPESNTLVTLVDSFYRAGALVFGGGHVVLPLLHAEFVQTAMLNDNQFLVGYGLAQAVPGPLFSFATYIGAVTSPNTPILAATIATVAIFLPGMLLLFALLPIWQSVRQISAVRGILAGINASVVGILAAVLINPLATAGIQTWHDGVTVVFVLLGLVRFKLHPLWAIALCLCFTLGRHLIS